MNSDFNWTIRLGLISVLLLVISVLCMGGGHGSYIPAMVLFPFGMLGTVWFDTITLPFIIMGLLQFPVYGYVIDKTQKTGKWKMAVSIIFIFHFLLAAIIIIQAGENWK